jgi:hypothetical protein
MNSILNSEESNLTLTGVFYSEVVSLNEPTESNLEYTASFLRFFGDGTVISSSVIFPDLDIMSLWQNSMSKWFNLEDCRHYSGKYTLTDKKIEFWAGQDSEGFQYFHSGNYNEDELTLDVCPEYGSWDCDGRTYTYKRLTSS